MIKKIKKDDEKCFDNETYEELCYFDKMNIVIIKYCEELLNKKQKNDELKFSQKEIIRVFCRYLLAEHWEKNQNKKLKFKNKRKEAELCVYTLTKFNSLYGDVPFEKTNVSIRYISMQGIFLNKNRHLNFVLHPLKLSSRNSTLEVFIYGQKI